MKMREHTAERPIVVLASPAPSVWRRAVVSFLKASSSLDFHTLSADRESCLADIERLQPDWVVLLTEGHGADISPTLTEVLSAVPTARVLLINRSDNNVHIHRCEQLELTQPENLIDLIARDTRRQPRPSSDVPLRHQPEPHSAAVRSQHSEKRSA